MNTVQNDVHQLLRDKRKLHKEILKQNYVSLDSKKHLITNYLQEASQLNIIYCLHETEDFSMEAMVRWKLHPDQRMRFVIDPYEIKLIFTHLFTKPSRLYLCFASQDLWRKAAGSQQSVCLLVIRSQRTILLFSDFK